MIFPLFLDFGVRGVAWNPSITSFALVRDSQALENWLGPPWGDVGPPKSLTVGNPLGELVLDNIGGK